MKSINQFLKESESLPDGDIEVSCKVILFNRVVDDPTSPWKALVLRRSSVSGYGQWDFPGGHMKKDEEKKDAAFREVKEESDLDIKDDSSFKFVKTIYLELPGRSDKPKMHIFEGESTNTEVTLPCTAYGDGSPEHNEYKWVSDTEEINNMPMLPQLKEVLISTLNKKHIYKS